MLDTNPVDNGSSPITKMIGMLVVAAFAACAEGVLAPTIADTLRAASSAASFDSCCCGPSAQRDSIATLSLGWPDSRRPWRSAATRWPDSSALDGLRNPITGIADCCASAVIGHAAAPLSNVMNSRRLIASPRGSRQGIVSAQTSTLEGGGHALRGRTADVRYGPIL